jgi:HEAT repeat protein
MPMLVGELWIVAVLGLTGVILGSASRARGSRERKRSWRAAAGILGLQDLSEPTASSLAGRSGTRRVCFEYAHTGSLRGSWLVGAGDSGVTLQPETSDSRGQKAMGQPELQIGDAEFDDEVYIEDGRTEVLRAILDVETRALLRKLFEASRYLPRGLGAPSVAARVVNGELQLKLDDVEYVGRSAELAEAGRMLLEMAPRLDRPSDLPARIAENTRRETEWRVRMNNVSLLTARHAKHPSTRAALEAARADPQQEVRLLAALALGEVGPTTLVEIASLRSWDEPCVDQAIVFLEKHITPDNCEEILEHALRSRQSKTIQVCLRTLSRAGSPSAIEALGRVLKVEGGELAVAAAEALSASGQADAERPLLEILARGSTASVRVAITEALGRVGSATAVLPLHELTVRPGMTAPERRAARQALAEIRSRLHGATPGQLSLAEGDAGDLSLADEDAGRLSLGDEDRSRLSPVDPRETK